MSQIRALVTLAFVGILLSGCAVAPSPASTATPAEVVTLMEAVPGVADVELLGESVVAHVAVETLDDVVLAAAEQLSLIGHEYEWAGRITLSREPEPYDARLDVTPRPSWSVEVYPAEVDDSLRDELLSELALERIDGVVTVAILDGWPHVTLGSIDSFADDFRVLIATPMFADGGTVRLDGEDHLRIVWVPTRTSLDAIDAIVGIAADYPGAEVLLEATTAGPQWPALYVARLSAEEAAAVEQRLLDPALADADVEGYGLPFILTSIGPDGPVYLDGNLGGVVE